MASAAAEKAVRTYLSAIADQATLLDAEKISALERQLSEADDLVQRVVLQQELLEARDPSVAKQKAEEAFITHAKAWADSKGVSGHAFTQEGVSPETLRKAGFDIPAPRGRGRRRTSRSDAPRRGRVTVDEIRAAIPKGAFTVKSLEDASGASTASVRKVIAEQMQSGNVLTEGADPDHTGPGRAPLLYRRK